MQTHTKLNNSESDPCPISDYSSFHNNSDIDLVCNITASTAGYASSDMDLAHIATGYASNDIDLGCTTIGNIEFTALGTGWLGMPVLHTVFGYTNKKNINLGYITIRKLELSVLIGYRRVGYAISVHTQPLGTLAVV